MCRSLLCALAMLAGAAALGLGLIAPVQAQETVKIGLLFTYSGASGMTGQIAGNVIKRFPHKKDAATQGIVERSPYFERTFFSIPQSVRPIEHRAHESRVKNPSVVVADCAPGHGTETTLTKTFTEVGGAINGIARVPVRSPEFSTNMQRVTDA